jgi:hypothetical protein
MERLGAYIKRLAELGGRFAAWERCVVTGWRDQELSIIASKVLLWGAASRLRATWTAPLPVPPRFRSDQSGQRGFPPV